MNSMFHGGVFVRAVFLTGCASLWVAWGSDGVMPSTVVGTIALGLAAAVALASLTNDHQGLAAVQLRARGARRRLGANALAMQAVPVRDALRAPAFGPLPQGQRARPARVAASPDAAGNPAPAYAVNVSRAEVPGSWTSMLTAPFELLAVAWTVPVLMLLVAVPIALLVALLLRIARLAF
jgi:hypothetical protein